MADNEKSTPETDANNEDHTAELRAAQNKETLQIVLLMAALLLIYMAVKLIIGTVKGTYSFLSIPLAVVVAIVVIAAAVTLFCFDIKAIIKRRTKELEEYYRMQSEENAQQEDE
jgi:TRAP-type C4-dicarboxylate transport system permease small subunit